MLLLCLAAAAASSGPCQGLQCHLEVGVPLVWRSAGWGELNLTITAEASAGGSLELHEEESAGLEEISASLAWSPSGGEVLVSWTSKGVDFSGFVVSSDPSHMILHSTQGAIVELELDELAATEKAAESEKLKHIGAELKKEWAALHKAKAKQNAAS